MQLPGRLRSTTLGDLLGKLHRSEATGTLELAEDRGRTHRVHLSGGMVVAVEFDGATATLGEILRSEARVDDETLRRSLLRAITSRRLHGEVLVCDFKQATSVVDAALRKQMTVRLQRIDQLPDAQVLFRVTVRPPRGALTSAPLGPRDFLGGRKRTRDVRGGGQARFTAATPPPPRVPDPRASAWRILGVSPGADATEIKRAYRRLARSCHPDMHPEATDTERRALTERFAQVTDAYRTLVA
jgi:DnaJ-domain-containing protein 1